MNDSPLVTVNILSFNRKDDLQNTLSKVNEQDYKNIEVIVVDNASSDGSPEMVEKVFPEVKLIRLDKNIGIAAWNKGFEVARGEYVLVLDDDAYPAKDAIDLAVNRILIDDTIGCIALNVINNNPQNVNFRTHWLPDLKVKETEWPIFVGCAALFRKSLKIVMPIDYFIYQHEMPVAADIYNKNFKIFYDSKIKCFHYFKSSNSNLNEYYFFRNNLKFITGYLPFHLAIYYSSKLIFFFFFKSIYKKWFRKYLLVFKEFRFEVHKKISFRYFMCMRRLELFNIQILKRIFN